MGPPLALRLRPREAAEAEEEATRWGRGLLLLPLLLPSSIPLPLGWWLEGERSGEAGGSSRRGLPPPMREAATVSSCVFVITRGKGSVGV